MSYGSPEWQGWVLDEQTSLEHIKHAYDLGINAFDTANMYSNGDSERMIAKFIKKVTLPLLPLSTALYVADISPVQHPPSQRRHSNEDLLDYLG